MYQFNLIDVARFGYQLGLARFGYQLGVARARARQASADAAAIGVSRLRSPPDPLSLLHMVIILVTMVVMDSQAGVNDDSTFPPS